MSKTIKNKYLQGKKTMICPVCGVEFEPEYWNQKYCRTKVYSNKTNSNWSVCSKKASNARYHYRKRRFEDRTEYLKKKRDRWIKNGLCGRCGKENDTEFITCQKCREEIYFNRW